MKLAKQAAAPKKRKVAAPDDDVLLATDDLASALCEAIGDKGTFVLGSSEQRMKIKGIISTRCPTLDAAIGRGGIPIGRLTIFHGGEGTAKTTLALHLCAEVQRRKGIVYYIDKEYKLDPDYAQSIGVDTNKIVIAQPENLEDTIEQIEKVIQFARRRRIAMKKKGIQKMPPVLIVLDSLNATQAQASIDNQTGKKKYADEARIWSQELPEIIKQCSKEHVALVFISQIRTKMNVMFGDANEIACGNAPRFHASLILFVTYIGSIKKDVNGKKVRVANRLQIECKKNQIAPPHQRAALTIKYGKGIDFYDALLEQATAEGIIEYRGKKYIYEEEVLGLGKIAATIALRKNKQLSRKINAALRRRWEEEIEAA